MIDQLKSGIVRFLTPDWLTAFGTISATVVALFIALLGKRITRAWFHPKLNLEANVKRPDSERARRGQRHPAVTVEFNPDESRLDLVHKILSGFEYSAAAASAKPYRGNAQNGHIKTTLDTGC